MMSRIAIAVFVAIGTVFFALDTGIAIKCFVCNSFHQADCVDWFDNVTQHLVQCFDWQRKCRKVVQEVWLDDHWDVRYIRQCAGEGEVGMYDGRVCQERYGAYNVRVRYCHCDNQDGCNSAPTSLTAPTVLRFILTTFTALVIPHLLFMRR